MFRSSHEEVNVAALASRFPEIDTASLAARVKDASTRMLGSSAVAQTPTVSGSKYPEVNVAALAARLPEIDTATLAAQMKGAAAAPIARAAQPIMRKHKDITPGRPGVWVPPSSARVITLGMSEPRASGSMARNTPAACACDSCEIVDVTLSDTAPLLPPSTAISVRHPDLDFGMSIRRFPAFDRFRVFPFSRQVRFRFLTACRFGLTQPHPHLQLAGFRGPYSTIAMTSTRAIVTAAAPYRQIRQPGNDGFAGNEPLIDMLTAFAADRDRVLPPFPVMSGG